MSKKKLKEGTLEICNLPDFSEILGCFTPGEEDEHTHLGNVLQRITACGRSVGDMMPFSRDVVIDCPDCVAELTHRGNDRKAANQPFGVVTHKE